MHTRHQNLVGRLIDLLPVPPAALAPLVAAVLVVPLVLLAFAHGAAAAPQGWWRLAMAPALIAFVVGVHPWLQGRWHQATDALRPLARQPEMVDQDFIAFDARAVVALLLGTALALWISLTTPLAGGLSGYLVATNVALFCLLALVIHDGHSRTRHLKRLVAAGLDLDLFDRQRLTPLARFGQGVSLTFVGGISLSLIFQSAASLYTLQALVIYSILIAAALTLLFSSMWSVHVALVAAQERELAAVRRHWKLAREAHRRQCSEAGATEEALRLYQPLVVFGSFERQVLEASTWPFNPKIFKEVAAALVAPVMIYGAKVALGLSAQP